MPKSINEIYAEEHQLNLCRRASTKSMPKSINEIYAEEHQRIYAPRSKAAKLKISIVQRCEAENIVSKLKVRH
jgi:hypothetical protein